MKIYIISIISGVLFGIIGFFLGLNTGYEHGINSAEEKHNNMPIFELKNKIKIKECESINEYISSHAKIKRYNDGFYYYPKYQMYLVGNITNSSSLTTIKDVVLKIDYYSKTGTKTGSESITVYEYIKPGKTTEFQAKINAPEVFDNFELDLIRANCDN